VPRRRLLQGRKFPHERVWRVLNGILEGCDLGGERVQETESGSGLGRSVESIESDEFRD
jgi:hypothetical protein